jgi:hypothetical protein
MQLLDGYVTNLLQLPCCCVFLLGLTMQLNFSRVGDNTMQLHYPVILLGLIGVLIDILLPQSQTASVSFGKLVPLN